MGPDPQPDHDNGDREPIRIIWMGGAGCDGCTMSVLGARSPRLEDLLAGNAPGLPAAMPPIELIHPGLALESGTAYQAVLRRASKGDLRPFFLVLEGSIMDEARALARGGSFSRLGMERGRAVTSADWVERLAPEAEGVIAIGSCATWGGVPAATPNPTGAVGLTDHLGSDFRSRAGMPIVNVPGCAPSGEAFLETVVYTLLHWQGIVPLDVDELGRPRWLYTTKAYPLPPRMDEEPPKLALAREIAEERPEGLDEGDATRVARALRRDEEAVADALALLVRSSTGCPVPRKAWMGGIGGCSRVGGSCIGCTDRGFTDRHLAAARPWVGDIDDSVA